MPGLTLILNFMKPANFFIAAMLPLMAFSMEQPEFSQYFTDRTIRIDYYHTGDARTEYYILDRIRLQGSWAGNPGQCIQPFDRGTYIVEVFDKATNHIIFSKGYSTIFAEYQTTAPAIRGEMKTYHESVLIPFPRKPFLLVIEKRDKQNIPVPVFKVNLDPADYHINTESYNAPGDVVIPVLKSGDPHSHVDMVILSEGYRPEELDRFRKDLKYYNDLLFSVEPFRSRKHSFNITGIFSPSGESGTDEPRQGIYRNTRFGSSFNSLDLDRYCLDEDNRSIRDAAGQVAYDAILIMVNRDRYGGGGIYNWQTVFCTGSAWRDYVFLHEFGHALAGLGDEYFSSPVAYVDFFAPGVEPLDPNITALPDTANVKWKQYLSPGIRVPTEWSKAIFDSLNNRIRVLTAEKERILDSLKHVSGAADMERTAREYNDRVDRLNRELDDFFRNHPLKDKVGVFEGASYMSEGFYRPTLMSLMHKFSEDDRSYGIVNEQAIITTIRYYTGE